VIVGYGVTVPSGSLPVFSVDTEEEAKALVLLACETDAAGNHFAKELVEEQSLDNLQAFSDRLSAVWDRMTKTTKGARK